MRLEDTRNISTIPSIIGGPCPPPPTSYASEHGTKRNYELQRRALLILAHAEKRTLLSDLLYFKTNPGNNYIQFFMCFSRTTLV